MTKESLYRIEIVKVDNGFVLEVMDKINNDIKDEFFDTLKGCIAHAKDILSR